MQLKIDEHHLQNQVGIAEGDPLPPEDRVRSDWGHWLDMLYRTHCDRLLRFARRYAHVDAAPDIVHQLFARLAARGSEAPLNVEAPTAYLRQATINLIRSEARQELRRSKHLHVCIEDVEVGGGDPVAAAEARDILAHIEAIVMRLPVRTREIFLAHRIDGYSYTEIAARTGLSVKTVEKHMSRAIGYVARHLEV